MPSKTLKTLEVTTCEEWREWLTENHESVSEVWLIFHKKQTGRASIPYLDALDEALCFGWIDSLIKRLDDERYARKFTPRRADSIWSDVNRKRYAELQSSGRLMPAGVKRPPTNRSYGARPLPRPLSAALPQYIQKAFASRPAARKYFDSLTAPHRRRYIAWIDSAKQQETKDRRLREAIDRLASGRKLGLK